MACSDWRPVVLDQFQDAAGMALAFWSTMQVPLRQVSIGTAEWVGRCVTWNHVSHTWQICTGSSPFGASSTQHPLTLVLPLLSEGHVPSHCPY